ncbi:MAG TPA: hypothetical protein VIK91_19810, partial [Nannocystis sp.]
MRLRVVAAADQGRKRPGRLTRAGDLAGAAVWWLDGGELQATRLDGLPASGRTAAAVASLRAAELVRAQILARAGGDEAVRRDISQPAQPPSTSVTGNAATSEDGASNRSGRTSDRSTPPAFAADARPGPQTITPPNVTDA